MADDDHISLPPVDPVFLTWENLNVIAKATNRQLLDKVKGVAQPGQLIALMGASGAGKTTLLNALLQRNIKGLHLAGTIEVNGYVIGRKITKVSAYIQQQNLFVETLTVREHLNLQSRLRLPPTFTKAEREIRIQQVISELDLRRCQSSRIGSDGTRTGVTSGEAKRLAFATEILTNPSLLFADEPTTGIDSFMAYQVVKVLERLASENGKTIICTIHQPASEIFEMFDQVLFLANGRVAFFGTPHQAIIFFGECGYKIPAHTNPADFFIQKLAIVPGIEAECTRRTTKITDQFLKSKYQLHMDETLVQIKKLHIGYLVEYGKATIPSLICALFIRSFIDNLRNPSLMKAKLIQKFVMGLFLGTLYLRTPMDQDGVINIRGALFYYISELTYSTVFGIQTFLPSDFPLLVREYHDGIYPVSCYYIAKICSYLPIFTLDGMIMVGISYFLIGLYPEVVTFFNTMTTCVLVEWSAASIGIMISSVSPSYAVAVSISGPLLTVFSITGGLYTNIKKIPDWIRWIQYFSWFRYGYESLIINEFRNYDNITCKLSTGKTAKVCEDSGQLIISNLNFENKNMYFNLGAMVFYVFSVFIIGYIGLVIRVQLARGQMTISYNVDIASSSPLTFFRVLRRWKGSVWKSVSIELSTWTISLFERIATYFRSGVDDIPLTFILGFFVNVIIQRWTDVFNNMGYLETQAIYISGMITGNDDRARLVRRTVARYLCLTQVLVYRDISVKVRKRFPTDESIVKAGFILENERIKMSSYKLDYDKYWVPINWAFALIIQARSEGLIVNDTYATKITDEIRNFRNNLQTLCNYDWVEIPLVYPQVVFLSVHAYFIVCLIGRQFLIKDRGSGKNLLNLHIPIMTMLQYLFFVGWMKVAESLLNPFGEDDDDFECNWLIDKNFATSMFIVDEAYHDLPELEKDRFWLTGEVEPIYSKETASIPINPLIGSATRAKLSMEETEPEMMVRKPTGTTTETAPIMRSRSLFRPSTLEPPEDILRRFSTRVFRKPSPSNFPMDMFKMDQTGNPNSLKPDR